MGGPRTPGAPGGGERGRSGVEAAGRAPLGEAQELGRGGEERQAGQGGPLRRPLGRRQRALVGAPPSAGVPPGRGRQRALLAAALGGSRRYALWPLPWRCWHPCFLLGGACLDACRPHPCQCQPSSFPLAAGHRLGPGVPQWERPRCTAGPEGSAPAPTLQWAGGQRGSQGDSEALCGPRKGGCAGAAVRSKQWRWHHTYWCRNRPK